MLATVRYLAIQRNPIQQPVMAYGIVPIVVVVTVHIDTQKPTFTQLVHVAADGC